MEDFAENRASVDASKRQTHGRRNADQALLESKAELERRVEERTAELQNANNNLIAEIVQRKLVEAELRRTEEQLKLAQKASGSGLWDWNPRSDVVTWSDEHLRLFGLTPSQRKFGWTTFFELIYPGDRARMEMAVRNALKPKGELNADYRIRRSDGQIRWVMSKGQTYCDAAGEPIRMIGLTFDVTERKQLEQALFATQLELAHASRLLTLGELTTSIAHEVNQPLAAAMMNGHACLRWLATDPPNLDKVRESLAEIVKESNRASEVIKRIRTFAKKAAPLKDFLAVNDLILEVVELLDAELAKTQVSVQKELAPSLPEVFGDRVQLQQVILNLMVNGIEAMNSITERPKELTIRSKTTDRNEVLISVSDRGTGLGMQPPDRLFDTFFTTKKEGIGLGLSISRTIVEAHGGRLWATQNVFHGATFQFTLPVAEEFLA